MRRNKVNKKKKREPNTSNPQTPTTPTPSEPTPSTEPKKRKVKTEKMYNTYALAPVLLKNEEGYLLRVQVKHDMKDCEFRIHSINSDEKVDNSIADILVSAYDNKKKYRVVDGRISKIKLNKNEVYELQIKTSREIRYRLTTELWYKEA